MSSDLSLSAFSPRAGSQAPIRGKSEAAISALRTCSGWRELLPERSPCWAIWKTSSLAAIIAFASLPGMTWIRHPEPVMVCFALGVTALIYYRHIENIRRLLKGGEPKFGMGQKAK